MASIVVDLDNLEHFLEHNSKEFKDEVIDMVTSLSAWDGWTVLDKVDDEKIEGLSDSQEYLITARFKDGAIGTTLGVVFGGEFYLSPQVEEFFKHRQFDRALAFRELPDAWIPPHLRGD